MTNQRFIPVCEKLESKLLLAVVAGIAGPEPDVIDSVEVDSANAVSGLAATARPEITIGMEHHGADSILVIQFDTPPSEPCTVCIVGGDTAVVQPDGTARLRLPQNPGIYELTIASEGEAPSSFLQIELERGGHILNHAFLEGEASNTDSDSPSNSSQFVISPDHSSMHSVSVPNPVSGPAIHGHVAVASLGVRSQVTNAIMTDHHSSAGFGSVQSSMGNAHNSSFSERTSRHPAAEVQSEEASQNEHSFADEIASAGKPIVPQVAQGAPDENMEEILANWTDGQESVAPQGAIAFDPHARPAAMPQVEPSNESTVPSSMSQSLEAVFSTHLAEILPTPIDPAEAESSSLPAISAVAIAIAAAASAYELERRAMLRSAQHALAVNPLH